MNVNGFSLSPEKHAALSHIPKPRDYQLRARDFTAADF